MFVLDKEHKLDIPNARNPRPSEEDKKLVVVKSPNAVNPLVWEYHVSNNNNIFFPPTASNSNFHYYNWGKKLESNLLIRKFYIRFFSVQFLNKKKIWMYNVVIERNGSGML